MDPSRREFLEKIILASASTILPIGLGSLTACSGLNLKNASDRIRIAIIGMGHQGIRLAQVFSRQVNCEIVTISEVDPTRARSAKELIESLQGKSPKTAKDFRSILDDKSIDAVVIANPNHWHALSAVWAMQAGKHVYLEKPVTHNIFEAKMLRKAVNKYQRVVQSGTQFRSNSAVWEAEKLVKKGVIGDVKLVKTIAYLSKQDLGKKNYAQIPPGLDYNLWSGPADIQDIRRQRFHRDWHWFWEYGNGSLGNVSIHRMDVARKILGLKGFGDTVFSYGGRFGVDDFGETPNTQITIQQFGPKTIIQELRELPSNRYLGQKVGTIFFGTKGHLKFQNGRVSIFDLEGKKVRTIASANSLESHVKNFLSAIHNNNPKEINGSLEECIMSSALCHIGSICHRIGKETHNKSILEELSNHNYDENVFDTLERTKSHLQKNNINKNLVMGPFLKLNKNSEDLFERSDANALLGRNYRAPFAFPTII